MPYPFFPTRSKISNPNQNQIHLKFQNEEEAAVAAAAADKKHKQAKKERKRRKSSLTRPITDRRIKRRSQNPNIKPLRRTRQTLDVGEVGEGRDAREAPLVKNVLG
jgi:hypothetical protein